MLTSPVVNTYPLSSYTFGTKEPKMEKDTSVADRLARMKVNYMKEGMRTSVEAILLLITSPVLHHPFLQPELEPSSPCTTDSPSPSLSSCISTPLDYCKNPQNVLIYMHGISGNRTHHHYQWQTWNLVHRKSNGEIVLGFWGTVAERPICLSFGAAAICGGERQRKGKNQREWLGWENIIVGLVQEHNHPHILLLQIGNTFCKLPGGRLKPGESEIEGLKRKLSSKLGANSPSLQPNWQIGECVAIWWRPNFETIMYPYCPPHITKPKECKKLFLVHLSEREYFAVPKNLKLLAVPLFELYDNVQRYGPVISTIPQQLSRFHFNMIHM